LIEAKPKLFETIVLYHPEVEPSALDERVKKVGEVVGQHGGTMLSAHRWKKRRLAYAVKKQEEGSYVVYRFTSDKRVLPDLDYMLRYDESCLRYLILDVAKYPGMLRGKQRAGEEQD